MSRSAAADSERACSASIRTAGSFAKLSLTSAIRSCGLIHTDADSMPKPSQDSFLRSCSRSARSASGTE
jgi:hypothetical protein